MGVDNSIIEGLLYSKCYVDADKVRLADEICNYTSSSTVSAAVVLQGKTKTIFQANTNNEITQNTLPAEVPVGDEMIYSLCYKGKAGPNVVLTFKINVDKTITTINLTKSPQVMSFHESPFYYDDRTRLRGTIFFQGGKIIAHQIVQDLDDVDPTLEKLISSLKPNYAKDLHPIASKHPVRRDSIERQMIATLTATNPTINIEYTQPNTKMSINYDVLWANKELMESAAIIVVGDFGALLSPLFNFDGMIVLVDADSGALAGGAAAITEHRPNAKLMFFQSIINARKIFTTAPVLWIMTGTYTTIIDAHAPTNYILAFHSDELTDKACPVAIGNSIVKQIIYYKKNLQSMKIEKTGFTRTFDYFGFATQGSPAKFFKDAGVVGQSDETTLYKVTL